jgi:hypothetical protein
MKYPTLGFVNSYFWSASSLSACSFSINCLNISHSCFKQGRNDMRLMRALYMPFMRPMSLRRSLVASTCFCHTRASNMHDPTMGITPSAIPISHDRGTVVSLLIPALAWMVEKLIPAAEKSPSAAARIGSPTLWRMELNIYGCRSELN